jgi:membrane protease YdiL (CAAX protease family)
MSEPANDPPLVTRPDPPPAPARPRPGFWEAVLWCLLFVVVQVAGAILVILVTFTVYAVNAENPEKFVTDQLDTFQRAFDAKTPTDQRPAVPNEFGASLAWGMLAAQFAALGLVLLVVPRRIGRDWTRQLALRAPSKLHVLVVVMLAPGFIVLPDLVQALWNWVTGAPMTDGAESLRGVFGALPIPLAVLAVAVGPGIVEEFWCRGFVGRGLVSRYGFVVGVALTSVLFALMHGNPNGLPAYILMGAFLHFVYFATRSIWAPVLLHALNNGTAILFVLLGAAPDPNAGTPTVLYLAALGVVLFGSVALWTSRATLEPTDRKAPVWEPEYPGVSVPPVGANARLWPEAVSPAALVLQLASLGGYAYIVWRYVF